MLTYWRLLVQVSGGPWTYMIDIDMSIRGSCFSFLDVTDTAVVTAILAAYFGFMESLGKDHVAPTVAAPDRRHMNDLTRPNVSTHL